MSVLLAFLSSVAWGSADFYGGLVSKRLSVYAVVGGSQAAGLAAVTVAAIATNSVVGPTDWLVWSMLAGFSGVIGLLMFYTALSQGTMGVVSPIAALGAVVPVAFGFARGEEPSPLAMAGIVVGLSGAFLASGPELRTPGSAVPIALAAISGMCFGRSTRSPQCSLRTSCCTSACIGSRSWVWSLSSSAWHWFPWAEPLARLDPIAAGVVLQGLFTDPGRCHNCRGSTYRGLSVRRSTVGGRGHARSSEGLKGVSRAATGNAA